VLDVGCGFGDFYAWAKRQGISIDYIGVDLSPDLISKGKQLYPDVVLHVGELFDCEFNDQSFDWVILSGAMNEQFHDDGEYARQLIAKMYGLCRKGVAFNMLDARYIQAHDLQSVDPQAMLAYCKTITPSSTLRDDYLKNDFSIYMLRQG
jgi:SAM-dependent methyltransferase